MVHRRSGGRNPGRLVPAFALLAALVCGCHSAHHPARPTTTPTTKTATPTPTTPTSVAPVVNIQPLPVRPVKKSQPTTAEKCPAPDPNRPAAPGDALTACDMGRTTLYTLGPEAMQLGLTQVEAPKALTSNFYEVTLILTPPSATAWASFTAANLHDHMAFIRDNLVLEAPIIEEQVTSGRIALTTQTAEAADRLAQLASRPA